MHWIEFTKVSGNGSFHFFFFDYRSWNPAFLFGLFTCFPCLVCAVIFNIWLLGLFYRFIIENNFVILLSFCNMIMYFKQSVISEINLKVLAKGWRSAIAGLWRVAWSMLVRMFVMEDAPSALYKRCQIAVFLHYNVMYLGLAMCMFSW